MKTNPLARRNTHVRFVWTCIGFAVLVLIELGLVQTLALRIGHTTGQANEVPQAPNTSLCDLAAAAQ